jgi:acetyl-CoA carboxylase biotin carboxyl carrier protein
MIDLDHLRKILELVRAFDVRDLEIEAEGLKLRVRADRPLGADDRRHEMALSTPPAAVPPAPMPASSPQPAVPVAAVSAPASPAPAPVDAADLVIVTSPIVGTFYRAPEPGARPFVEPGQQVRRGQVLCIIEAMKLMNEIESECAGEIVSIFVENEQAVQYGEKLFAIRKL